MSRIFLSHSSRDEHEAIALKQWLKDQGWDDVFLDLDPERGLVAGERWQEALRKAADRCEAVVFIVSPDWAKSKWCLAEFLLAKSLNKRIFGVMLKEVPIKELPTEMTSEWQLAMLVGEGPTESVRFEYKGAEEQLEFLGSGLKRLKIGLQKAGFAADFFPWPPEDDPHRSPYRGLQPLEIRDAAVFFGRDTEILQGLDTLRGMRGDTSRQLFVILGASGAGKSSFLRAGLLPRLKRDDRHFLVLPVVRPQSAPISGEAGLARALHDARVRLRIAGATLGQIKKELKESPSSLPGLLDELRAAARSRIGHEPGEAAPVPTVVISVDQGEELFSTDAGDEARPFLKLLAGALRDGGESSSESIRTARTIVVITIRSDGYEPLQTAAELEGIRSQVFDELKPMPPTRFREVITGPAKRASIEGGKLEVRPELVERLVSECTAGGDTLPLLGLTLERLYCDYGSDGDLRLDEYEAMGGLANVVKTEAESVLSSDSTQRREELEQLRAAFIPWLVTINPLNDQPMRRAARRADLPEASRPLVDALAEKRLLLTDQRDGESVIEVAHEAIFRQWDVPAGWIREHRDDFRVEESVERAASEWQARQDTAGREAWLLRGERLRAAEALAGKPGFRERLDQCREFLTASRRFEEAERGEQERRRNAELEAARQLAEEQRSRAEEQAKHSRRLRWALGVVAILAVAAGIAAKRAVDQTTLAEEQTRLARQQTLEANARRLVAESSAMLSARHGGGTERALLQTLAVHRVAPSPASEAALLDGILGTQGLEWIVAADEQIYSAVFSPDGRRIVSGSEDGTVRLWDAVSGAAIGAPLEGHGGRVTSVAFSADGTRIVSGGADGTVRRWDAASGAAIGAPREGHGGRVTSVAFSPDGTRIVSSGADGAVRLWDAASGAAIGAPLEGHLGWVTSVAFSPDGRRIASGDEVGTVRLWDAASGAAIGAPLKGHRARVTSVTFSPDGERIVSGSADDTLRLWDAASGVAIGAPLEGHQGRVTTVAISPDGTRIASGGEDGTVRLSDAVSGEPIGAPLEGHRWRVTSVAFSPDGTRIVSGGEDGTLRLWYAAGGAGIGASLEGHRESVCCTAFSPGGRRIVSGGADGTVRLWDAASGVAIGAPLEGHRGWVTSVAFSPDGTRIVSGGEDGTVRRWDAASGVAIGAPLEGHRGSVWSVAFGPDGERIVSGGADGTVRRWDAASGAAIGAPLEGHGGSVPSIAFSSDGTRIVSGSVDGTVRLWDAASGAAIGAPLDDHQGRVWSTAFSPDGTRIVSGGEDGTVRLSDAVSGEPIGAPLEGHRWRVTSVAFSPDGERIVSGGADGTVRLWDAASGTAIGAPLQGHQGRVWSTAFSPDGTRIVSGGEDGTVRLWPGPLVWSDEVCNRLTRNMSRREWSAWVAKDLGDEYVCQCSGLPIPGDRPEDTDELDACREVE